MVASLPRSGSGVHARVLDGQDEIEVNPTPRSGAFGRVHGIQYDPPTRTWIGAADPDWEGSARGPTTGRGGN